MLLISNATPAKKLMVFVPAPVKETTAPSARSSLGSATSTPVSGAPGAIMVPAAGIPWEITPREGRAVGASLRAGIWMEADPRLEPDMATEALVSKLY